MRHCIDLHEEPVAKKIDYNNKGNRKKELMEFAKSAIKENRETALLITEAGKQKNTRV